MHTVAQIPSEFSLKRGKTENKILKNQTKRRKKIRRKRMPLPSRARPESPVASLWRERAPRRCVRSPLPPLAPPPWPSSPCPPPFLPNPDQVLTLTLILPHRPPSTARDCSREMNRRARVGCWGWVMGFSDLANGKRKPAKPSFPLTKVGERPDIYMILILADPLDEPADLVTSHTCRQRGGVTLRCWNVRVGTG